MIDDFRDLLAAFVDDSVHFLVVGAHALAALGVPRATGDLDVWVRPTEDNAAAVWRALAKFGAPLSMLNLHESDFRHPDRVVQLGLPPYRIDILTSISGVAFEEAWDGRVAGTLFGVTVSFIGRDAFLRNKRASGRPRDLEDIRSLG